jgi:hypothetical protein
MAPRRGKPPPVPEGYEIAPGDPFVFILRMPDCDQRYWDETKCKKCPGTQPIMTCRVVEKRTTRTLCVECGATPDFIKEKYGVD